MSTRSKPRTIQRAPIWLLVLALSFSALLHAGFVFYVSTVFSMPKLDLEFQLPMDIELGMTDEMAKAGPATPEAQGEPEEAAKPPENENANVVSEEQPPVEKPKPKKKRKQEDADAAVVKAPATDAGVVGAGSDQNGTSLIPAGAQIAVRVDMTRIRVSPIAEDVRTFLAAIPDWQALLAGSGIDPLEQLDRILLATPNLQREKVVIAGRYIGERSVVDSAVQNLARAQGVEATWRTVDGVEVAPWANLDKTPRVIALLGPQHFSISREQDLARVLAIAAARVEQQKDNKKQDQPEEGKAAPPPQVPADALLSMEEGEGLSLEVEGVEQFVARTNKGIPARLRISATEIAGDVPSVRVAAKLTFLDAEKAANGLRFWDKVRKMYAQNSLVAMLGLAGPLENAMLEVQGEELRITVQLSVEHTRLIIGYLRELVTPPPPSPSLPRNEPAQSAVEPPSPAPSSP